MPLQEPVLKRELANKMYHPTSYYLGRFISNQIFQVGYPVILILTLFFFLGIENSFKNFTLMMSYGLLSNWIFACQGYLLGTLIPEPDAVNTVNVIFIILMLMTNGIISNLKTTNIIIKVLSFLTPARFITEGLYRRVVGNVPDLNAVGLDISKDTILNDMAFTYGDSGCLKILGIWCVAYPIIDIIAINLMNRNL